MLKTITCRPTLLLIMTHLQMKKSQTIGGKWGKSFLTRCVAHSYFSARQLQVDDIYSFIEANVTRYALLNLSSTIFFYGPRDSGKSTFLFQTAFFEMLLDQLCNPGEITGKNEGIKNLNGAWLQAYEIGVDPRTRVERKYNLLSFASKQQGK